MHNRIGFRVAPLTHRRPKVRSIRHEYAMNLYRRWPGRVAVCLPEYFGPDEYIAGRDYPVHGFQGPAVIALPDKNRLKRQRTLDDFGFVNRSPV